jgi:hypothetical protein
MLCYNESRLVVKVEEETTCADLHGENVTGELDGVVVGGKLDVVEAVLAVGIVQGELWGQDSSIQSTSETEREFKNVHLRCGFWA